MTVSATRFPDSRHRCRPSPPSSLNGTVPPNVLFTLETNSILRAALTTQIRKSLEKEGQIHGSATAPVKAKSEQDAPKPASAWSEQRLPRQLFHEDRSSQCGADAHAAVVHPADDIPLMSKKMNNLLLAESDLPQALRSLRRGCKFLDADRRPGLDLGERADWSGLELCASTGSIQ